MENDFISLRKSANLVGWAMLIYTGFILCFSFLRIPAAAAARWILSVVPDENGWLLDFFRELINGGTWSILAACASVGVLTLVFLKAAPISKIWQRTERKMTPLSFAKIFAVFMAFQFVFSLVNILLELVLNLFGVSAMSSLDAVTGSSDTWTMFLYAGIVAPVAEEIVYRGFVLRALTPYGKKLAILASALMFGLAHGNIHQIFYAATVGLVLAYIASEYSIWWSIALHLINNLIFVNVWDWVLDLFSDNTQMILSWGVQALFFVLAVVVFVVHWQQVTEGFHRNIEEETRLHLFLRSSGIIVFIVAHLALTVWTLVVSLSPVS